MNLCSKPRCARPGSVALAYDYAGRRAILHDPPDGEMSPHLYALCVACAEKLNPPRGWTLEDERVEPPLFATRHSHIGVPRIEKPVPAPAGVTAQHFFSSTN